MRILWLSWLSLVRRRTRLLLVTLPTAVLYGVVALQVAITLTKLRAIDPKLDRRSLRVGSPVGQGILTMADVEKLRRMRFVEDVGIEEDPGPDLVLLNADGTVDQMAASGTWNAMLLRQYSNFMYVPPEEIRRYAENRSAVIVGRA